MDLPLVGISSCLQGAQVRYDGRHKYNAVIADHLAPFVRLLPLCPESMAGLGIPRPPVQLIKTASGLRALGRDDPELDVTRPLATMGQIIARTYPELCGYVVQSRSPSCGYGTTPVLNSADLGNGLFIDEIARALPGLAIVNESELDGPRIKAFLRQVRERQQGIGYLR